MGWCEMWIAIGVQETLEYGIQRSLQCTKNVYHVNNICNSMFVSHIPPLPCMCLTWYRRGCSLALLHFEPLILWFLCAWRFAMSPAFDEYPINNILVVFSGLVTRIWWISYQLYFSCILYLSNSFLTLFLF